MANQYKNKIIYGNQTLMDITDTTATENDVLEGEVFYGANGARGIGTLGDATTTAHGLMSASDKIKLDGIDLLGVKLNTITLTPDANGYVSIPLMVGATSSADGTAGLIPAPTSADREKFFRGDGTWQDGGKPMVILSYGSSTWNDFINAYNNNVIVYCRASSNSNPATGTQGRMAFMAYIGFDNSGNPSNVEFQYYRSMSAHSVTAMGDEVYIYKLTSANAWSVTVRKASIKEIAISGNGLSVGWASDKVTLTTNTATTSIEGMMSSSDKTKLDGIDTNANNYSLPTTDTDVLGGIKVGYTTSNKNYAVQVDSNGNAYVNVPWENTQLSIGSGATDAAAGNHTHILSIATDSGTNQITLAASTKYKLTAGGSTYIFTMPPNTTYSAATQSAAGLMSAADKTKLDGIATSANNYSHPTGAGNNHIPSGGSSGQFLGWSSAGVAKWVNNPNTDHYAWSDITSKPSYYDAKAIKGITRSGTTFTYTCMDGTTGTFTQQDNNTTYSFSDKNVTLAWGKKSTIATVGGTDIHVTMPANPNTDHYAWSDITSKPATATRWPSWSEVTSKPTIDDTTILQCPASHVLSGVNANNYSNGIYYFTTSCSNVPDAWMLTLCYSYNSDFVIQFGICAASARVYVRGRWNGSWKSWLTLATY